MDLVEQLRKAAAECAAEDVNGWGNGFTAAADEIERLRLALAEAERVVNNLNVQNCALMQQLQAGEK